MNATHLLTTFAKAPILIVGLGLATAYAKAQIVDAPGGKGKIECIGLHQQTASDVIDRLAALNPGKPVHACAADLITRLGFADAAVVLYPDSDQGLYTVVTLVEAEKASRVKYRPDPADVEPAELPEWRGGVELVQKPDVVQAAAFSYLLVRNGKDAQAKALARDELGVEPADVEPLWAFLRAHATEGDRERAVWLLSHHGDPRVRVLAALVLVNFAASDSTWWHLADALRDRHASVNGTAGQVLRSLAAHGARPVDWRPALVTLRKILDGTNLFALPVVLDVLRRTEFPPEMREDLLTGRVSLLRDYVNARHPASRAMAVTFLEHLHHGETRTPEAWCRWLDSLETNDVPKATGGEPAGK